MYHIREKPVHFFDSHVHLTEPELLQEIEGVLSRAFGERVVSLVNICTTVEQLKEGWILSAVHPAICNAAATPPHTVEEEGERSFPFFEKAALEKKLCAIGETGLDYYHHSASKEVQRAFLIRYLHLAVRAHLPVIFHCREAFSDLFSIVDAEYPKEAPAVLHCFTGTFREAEQVLARGWFLSLSGIVTFKKSHTLREVAQMVPLSQLLIETDAPYLAPESRRGKRNEPSFLPETAFCIAEAKGLSLEEVAQATRRNGEKLFFSC